MANLVVSGNSTINEYAPGVNVTASIVANDSVDGNVTLVQVFRGAHATGTNVSINGNVISITGAYAEVFTKSITYLDVNRAPQTIPKFEDLPDKFFLLTNFTAPPVGSVVAEYKVYYDTTGNVIQSNVFAGTISQTVTNDYTAGKNALQAAVPKGIF
jgi:hypothetical protein